MGLKNQSQSIFIYVLKYSHTGTIFMWNFLVTHFRQQGVSYLSLIKQAPAVLWYALCFSVNQTMCYGLLFQFAFWTQGVFGGMAFICLNSKQQFRNESISNYSQIILGVSLQKEVNNELKQYFIPNSLYVISTSASQIGNTKSWPSVGTNDSQLFSLPSNLKKGYSEEWKIVISIHW